MIDYDCILASTPDRFAAWLQRTVLGGSFPFDESPAVRLVMFPPVVTWRDENGLDIEINATRLDTETGESIPFEVPVAVFGVGSLSGDRIEVHAALGNFTKRMAEYFQELTMYLGPDWPERTLTERQREIKKLRLQGLTIEGIAEDTGLSVRTVNRELEELGLTKSRN